MKLLQWRRGWECYRCGSTKHLADVCLFKTKEYFGCKQIGHIKKKCRNGSGRKIGWKSEGSRANCHRAEVVVEGEEDVFDSGMNFLSLYTLNGGSRKHDPIMVGMKLNGKEVDTGAAVSVMSLSQY